jgi:hypothetical protein
VKGLLFNLHFWLGGNVEYIVRFTGHEYLKRGIIGCIAHPRPIWNEMGFWLAGKKTGHNWFLLSCHGTPAHDG